MIELMTYKGTKEFVNQAAIARVTEASASSQWHGTRSIVKLFDGTVIECGDTAKAVIDKITAAEAKA